VTQQWQTEGQNKDHSKDRVYYRKTGKEPERKVKRGKRQMQATLQKAKKRIRIKGSNNWKKQDKAG
jgi:hypothetical protein